MSKAYVDEFGNEPVTREQMRAFVSRPGRHDPDGNPIYRTEQHHKKECDVNNIIKKYDKTGLITHVSRIEARFGDHTGQDFKDAMDLITGAQSMFNELPPEIRSRFDNDPGKLLEFMEHPGNRKEAIEIGLINESWPEALDGFGEHVERNEETGNVEKVDGETPE